MKKVTIVLSAYAVILAVALMGCESPAQKVENAQQNVMDANNDLAHANKDYLADIEEYRKETTAKIVANDKRIADLKQRTIELEKNNLDMKKKMDDYSGTGKENWVVFKAQFNRDMDALGQKFNELTTSGK